MVKHLKHPKNKKTNKKNNKIKSKNSNTKRKKNHKYGKNQRGGICYGSGVGANNYDPNFSIYGTRELELFPYRPLVK